MTVAFIAARICQFSWEDLPVTVADGPILGQEVAGAGSPILPALYAPSARLARACEGVSDALLRFAERRKPA